MTPYRKLAPLAAAAGLLATTGTASAATLLKGEFQTIGDTNTTSPTNPGISVTSGSEGYSTGNDGLGTGGLDGSFNAPILDYAFYTSGSGFTESLGGAASLIPLPSSSGTSTDVGGMDIWAGTTPDGTLSNADQTTWSRPQNISGSVDITGLASGSFYMFFGTRVGPGDEYDITFSLTGDGQDTKNLSQLGISQESQGGTANNTWFVYRADFADAAAYDTLTYTYNTKGKSAAQSRFGGSVLTSVPEPSAALLGALGLLALLRRRRA